MLQLQDVKDPVAYFNKTSDRLKTRDWRYWTYPFSGVHESQASEPVRETIEVVLKLDITFYPDREIW